MCAQDETTPRLVVDTRKLNHAVVLTARGDVDISTVQMLDDALSRAASGDASALIIDLTDVGFLATVGMSALLSMHRRVERQARVLVVADGPFTRRPMKLVGLDAWIEFHADLASALDAAATPGL